MKGGLGDCLTTISLRYCRLIADLSTNYFVILPTSSTDLVNYKCEIRTDINQTKKGPSSSNGPSSSKVMRIQTCLENQLRHKILFI